MKISDELLANLRHDWSAPVQVRVVSMDKDGDLELIFRAALAADTSEESDA